MSLVTVVTTTYNRHDLLTRCYESLLAQSCRDLEWLIVDDGSTDGTATAVATWQENSPFPIQLHCQENGGKHRALNRALATGSTGEYILLLDSDDVLVPDAIRILKDELHRHPRRLPAGFIGNVQLLGSGETVGRQIPGNLGATTGRELRERYGIYGDTVRVFRSAVIQEFKFPQFDHEKFVPENVVFDVVDRRYRMQALDRVLVLCDYQSGGLSSRINELRARNPRGFSASLESTAWVSKSPRWVVEYTLKYQVWNRVFRGVWGRRDFRRKAVFILCLPIAKLLYAARRPKFIFETHQSHSP